MAPVRICLTYIFLMGLMVLYGPVRMVAADARFERNKIGLVDEQIQTESTLPFPYQPVYRIKLRVHIAQSGR